jgi:hypothetical protein
MEDRPTVRVSPRGDVKLGTLRGTIRQGFTDLLDFRAPPSKVSILPRDAPTAIGVTRTGNALRDAMTAFGKTSRKR